MSIWHSRVIKKVKTVAFPYFNILKAKLVFYFVKSQPELLLNQHHNVFFLIVAILSWSDVLLATLVTQKYQNIQCFDFKTKNSILNINDQVHTSQVVSFFKFCKNACFQLMRSSVNSFVLNCKWVLYLIFHQTMLDI